MKSRNKIVYNQNKIPVELFVKVDIDSRLKHNGVW